MSGTQNSNQQHSEVLCVIDANCNRLREALRVIEEYFRFITRQARLTLNINRLRHKVHLIEAALGRTQLVAAREVNSDPLAGAPRANECDRCCSEDLLFANCNRAQEAARVIEEYAKLLPDGGNATEIAKSVRFELYTLEKELFHGVTQ